MRQNTISVNVGVLAPLSLKEAQSEEATDLSNVYQAEGQLDTARAVLRQDVMFNPEHTFLPVMLEPIQRPNPQQMPENDRTVAGTGDDVPARTGGDARIDS